MTITLPTIDGKTVEIDPTGVIVIHEQVDSVRVMGQNADENVDVIVPMSLLSVCALFAEAVAWHPADEKPVRDGEYWVEFFDTDGTIQAGVDEWIVDVWCDTDNLRRWRELPAVPQQEETK